MPLETALHRTRWLCLPLLACCLSSNLLSGAEIGDESGWLDIEALSNVRIVSFSRTEQSAFTTPAAVYVITDQDIHNSGAQTLPDVLRLAPGIESAYVNNRLVAVTLRGFTGLASNKFLPLIDGRSIYSLRYSGTIWDTRDLMLEDVERIEVIRGPGGTAWGSNAVNGIINVITRHARDTQGTYLSAGGGTHHEAFVTAREGFKLGEKSWMRVYTKAYSLGDSEPIDQPDANDALWQTRTGFRYDAELRKTHQLMLSGDVYFTEGDQFLSGLNDKARSNGGYLQGRYTVELDDASKLQAQLYYDRFQRDSSGAFTKADVIDGELQYEVELEQSHHVVLGTSYRASRLFDESSTFSIPQNNYAEAERLFNQVGVFAQDEWGVVPDRLTFTGGLKAEYNDFTGVEYMPNIRACWTPTNHQSLWVAASRAVRIPSRGEYDSTQITVTPGMTFKIIPNPDIAAEVLWAYEAGYRIRTSADLSFDFAVYYNKYDQLVALSQPTVVDGRTQLTTRLNEGTGESYGGELAIQWQALDWWRLQAALSHLNLEITTPLDPAAESIQGQSPENQVSVLSSWELGRMFQVDAWLRYVDELPATGIDAQFNLDVRLGVRLGEHLELSVTGQNLLSESSQEFRFPRVQQLARPRGVYVKVTAEF
ncbi:MAG: TonB-dependent receptor [Verrucomicrobiota bacterium]|nr:TonB-dependent receptor [Verrucomicrobiota bacterium]